MSALWKDVLEALESALPIIQYDAQMMADITRHAPLDPGSQAKHDSTEYASEHLVRTIPPLIERLKAALAEPQPEPVAWVDAFGEPSKTKDEQFRWPLCAAPQASLKPLTDEQMPPMPSTHWVLHMPAEQYEQEWTSCEAGYTEADMREYARAIEAAHGIVGVKNGTPCSSHVSSETQARQQGRGRRCRGAQ